MGGSIRGPGLLIQRGLSDGHIVLPLFQPLYILIVLCSVHGAVKLTTPVPAAMVVDVVADGNN